MYRPRMSLATCAIAVVGPWLAASELRAAPQTPASPVSPVCVSSLPSNIEAGLLRSTLLDLVQRSATVRQQCERIAATPTLRVSMTIAQNFDADTRGRTTIIRYDAEGIRARVQLRFGADYDELTAHEFEHIIEQLDRVVLIDEVAARRAWQTSEGIFETQRARDAGIRAREECHSPALALKPAQIDGRKAPRGRHLIQ